MKICIIGMPRSRSSVLLEAVSNFYQIDIIGQDIDTLSKRHGPEYLKTLKQMLNFNLSKIQGVIRLHPLQMIQTGPFVILDFDWFNFEQYDEIFFTTRENRSDNIASNFVATELNQFTLKSKIQIKSIETCMVFSEKDHYHVRDYIQSMKIIDRLKTYLETKSISYIKIDYDNILDFIDTTYGNIKEINLVPTDYDYQKIIYNYQDIEIVYNDLFHIYK